MFPGIWSKVMLSSFDYYFLSRFFVVYTYFFFVAFCFIQIPRWEVCKSLLVNYLDMIEEFCRVNKKINNHLQFYTILIFSSCFIDIVSCVPHNSPMQYVIIFICFTGGQSKVQWSRFVPGTEVGGSWVTQCPWGDPYDTQTRHFPEEPSTDDSGYRDATHTNTSQYFQTLLSV